MWPTPISRRFARLVGVSPGPGRSGSIPAFVVARRSAIVGDTVDDGHHRRYRRLDRLHSSQHPNSLFVSERWGAPHGTGQQVGAAANGGQWRSQVVPELIEGIERELLGGDWSSAYIL